MKRIYVLAASILALSSYAAEPYSTSGSRFANSLLAIALHGNLLDYEFTARQLGLTLHLKYNDQNDSGEAEVLNWKLYQLIPRSKSSLFFLEEFDYGLLWDKSKKVNYVNLSIHADSCDAERYFARQIEVEPSIGQHSHGGGSSRTYKFQLSQPLVLTFSDGITCQITLSQPANGLFQGPPERRIPPNDGAAYIAGLSDIFAHSDLRDFQYTAVKLKIEFSEPKLAYGVIDERKAGPRFIDGVLRLENFPLGIDPRRFSYRANSKGYYISDHYNSRRAIPHQANLHIAFDLDLVCIDPQRMSEYLDTRLPNAKKQSIDGSLRLSDHNGMRLDVWGNPCIKGAYVSQEFGQQ